MLWAKTRASPKGCSQNRRWPRCSSCEYIEYSLHRAPCHHQFWLQRTRVSYCFRLSPLFFTAPMLVLGIETSCDETGVALYDSGRGLLAHALYTQAALHAEYGGVVPELASRDHIRRVLPLTRDILHASGSQLSEIGAVACTQGPRLAGALLVGASVAQGLAYALGVPALGIHHLEGHLLSPLMAKPAPGFPFIALLVSGGHSQLMRINGIGQYEL